MNGETQGKLLTGMFGGILLMFIIQFAILNVLSSDIANHTYQYFVFIPFMLIVVMLVASLWLLERMAK